MLFSQADSGLLVAVITCVVVGVLVLGGLILFIIRQRLAQRTNASGATKTDETERIYREVDHTSFVEDLKWRLADLFQIRSIRNGRAR